MAIELLDFEHAGETYDARLNTPEDGEAAGCVVVLPGAGHGPFGDIFDVTAYELAGEGLATFRFETWTDPDELRAKSVADLHAELDAAVDYVADMGYDSLSMLVKSFGGRIGLTHVPDDVERVLGWAPAVRLSESSTLDERYGVPLGEADDLRLSASDVADADVPVRILHGDEDEVVSRDDARALVEALPDAELRELLGENHSFNEHRRTVVAETVAFLVSDR